jgi:hypothetical protein
MKVDSKKDSVVLFCSGTSMMVALYSVFVGIFFFTYGAFIEHKVLENQIENIVDSITRDVLPFVPDGIKTGLYDKLDSAQKSIKSKMNSPDNPDITVAKNNQKVKKTAFEMLAGIFIVGMGISVATASMYSGGSNKALVALLKKNALLLVFVIIVEFLFFTLVTKNYLSIDPNSVKKKIVQTLKKKLGCPK